MKKRKLGLLTIAAVIICGGVSCGTVTSSSGIIDSTSSNVNYNQSTNTGYNTSSSKEEEEYGTYSLFSDAQEGTKITFYVNQFNSNEVKKANEGDLIYFKVEKSNFETRINSIYSDDVSLYENIPFNAYSFIMPKKNVMIHFTYVENDKHNINVDINHGDVASLKVLVNGTETNVAYNKQTIDIEIHIKNEKYEFISLNLIAGGLSTTNELKSSDLFTDIEGEKYHFIMPNNDVSLILNVKIKKEYETFDNCSITFWHTMGKKSQEKLNAMIDEFNKKYPNIIIEHRAQGGYTDIESKIRKAIPAKRVPTMAFCYADHVAGYGNNTVDMTPYINSTEKILDKDGKETDEIVGLTAEEKADYIQGYWEEGSQYIREGFYSAPFSKSTEVIFYNASFFEAHKLPLPTKWESDDPNDLTAMWNLCRKIKEINASEIKVAEDWNKANPKETPKPVPQVITPLGYDSDDNMFITLCKQYDIPYTSIKDGKGSFDFNNDAAKALMKRLKGYYDEGLFLTKGTSEFLTYTSTKFLNQQIVMSIDSTGDTYYNVPDKDGDGVYEFDAKVAQIPQQNSERNYAISQGPSICFFKNSNISDAQVKASWLFYKFITSPENSADYALLTGYEPVRTSSYATQQYQDHLNGIERDANGKIKNAKDADGNYIPVDTLYTRVANLTATPAISESYFASPAFKGTAIARQQCGGIIALTMFEDASKVDINAKINEIFAKALAECELVAS